MIYLLYALQGVVFFIFGVLFSYSILESRAPNPSGTSFAEMLIEESDYGKQPIFLSSSNSMRKICFQPDGTFPARTLSREFDNMPVAFQDSDDSNHWYVAMQAYDRSAIVVLGVPHSVLSWIDINSPQNDITDFEIICPKKVEVVFNENDLTPELKISREDIDK